METQSKSLFEIEDGYKELFDLLDDLGGDITDPQVEAKITAIESELTSNLNEKADGYGWAVRMLEAHAAVYAERKERLAANERSCTNRAKWLKARFMQFMERMNLKKIETPHFTFSIRANGGKPPLVQAADLDPVKLPERFQKIEITLNNDAVRAALDAGEELEFASYGPRGSNLQIK